MSALIPPRPFELGLMFTHRCPIACRHCGMESGPSNRTAMPLALARRVIDEAAALDPPPGTIVFTGGEAMMYPAVLEELLSQCCDLGLSTRVVTNGFWARDPQKARRLLHRLRLVGLDSLNFSADRYHLEFLPAETFRNAIAVAAEVGFPIVVNMVMNAPGDPIAEFCALYGIAPDRVRLLDEEEFAAQMAAGTIPDEALTKINLTYGRLVGLGRAAEYPEEHHLSPLAGFARVPCGEIVNRPVVYPDGSFQACCCAGGKIASFTVGNLNEQSLAALFDATRARTHFRFINHFGPRRLAEVLCGTGEGDAGAPDTRFASICDVCVAATATLPAEEVDRRLERWLIGRFVGSAAAPPTAKELVAQ